MLLISLDILTRHLPPTLTVLENFKVSRLFKLEQKNQIMATEEEVTLPPLCILITKTNNGSPGHSLQKTYQH